MARVCSSRPKKVFASNCPAAVTRPPASSGERVPTTMPFKWNSGTINRLWSAPVSPMASMTERHAHRCSRDRTPCPSDALRSRWCRSVARACRDHAGAGRCGSRVPARQLGDGHHLDGAGVERRCRFGDEHLRPGVGQLIAHRCRPQRRVDRRHRGAQPHAAKNDTTNAAVFHTVEEHTLLRSVVSSAIPGPADRSTRAGRANRPAHLVRSSIALAM